MVTKQLKELAQLKARAAKLEAEVSAKRQAELASLPAAYGYNSLAAFIKALKQSGGARRKAGRPKAVKAGKRKRAKITDQTKAKVKAAVEAGKAGGAIAKELGISPASVQNIRKALGLVKARK